MAETPADRAATAYRRVLAAPGVLALFAASSLTAIPATAAAVALVLYVEHVTGSFAAAGLVTGAFTIGLGFTGPVLARMIDRFGTSRVVVPASFVESVALVLLVVLGDAGAGTPVLVLVAAVAGGAAPPVGGVLRRALPELLPPRDLPTAYALDSVQIEFLFVSGPLLAGVLSATLGPGACILIFAPLATIGALWFVSLVGEHEEPGGRDRRHGLAGAIASPQVRLLALSGVPLGATFGVLDVAFPAFGAAHGAPSIGGLLTATLALGSAIGGLVYGARPGRFGRPARGFLALSLAQSVTCLPLLLAWSVPSMFPLALIAAACVAPLVTVRNQIVGEHALPGTAVEAFTWMGLALTVGSSAGSAIAGPVVAAVDWRAAVGVACVFPVISMLVAVTGRRLLEAPPAAVDPIPPAGSPG